MTDKKDSHLNLRCSKEVRSFAEEVAKNNQVTPSAAVVLMIEEYRRKHPEIGSKETEA